MMRILFHVSALFVVMLAGLHVVAYSADRAPKYSTTIWHSAVHSELIRIERIQDENQFRYRFNIYNVVDGQIESTQDVIDNPQSSVGFSTRELNQAKKMNLDIAKLACNWITGLISAGTLCLAAVEPYLQADALKQILKHPRTIKIPGEEAKAYFDYKARLKKALFWAVETQ